jgi:GAF domain-containing protein
MPVFLITNFRSSRELLISVESNCVTGLLRDRLRHAVAASTIVEVAEAICRARTDVSAALTRIWVIDRIRQLRLVASHGNPVGGGAYARIDGGYATIELGVGKIGRIATTREALVARRIRGDEEWLANPAWAARQGVRSFAGFPLIANDNVLGVFATFDRSVLTDDALDDLEFAAEIVAACLYRLQDVPVAKAAAPLSPSAILTRGELRALEKRSIEAALARTNGKVFGANGAAALLEMKPTTLLSRIKAMGI